MLFVSNASAVRTQLINTMKVRRDQLFDQIWNYIAFGVAKNTDTTLIETQARGMIKSIKDQAEDLTKSLAKSKGEADTALIAIRNAAAEQGVSQQAIYFRTEADDHEKLASKWLTRTYIFAACVGAYAVLSIFIYKWDWIKPEGNAELAQLISSKLLLFAVLAYLLILSARNYANYKHNAVINRHRQNALLTYRALSEAAGDKGTENIVLANAAACIFAPQDTGFTSSKGGDIPTGSKSVLELMTKSSNVQ